MRKAVTHLKKSDPVLRAIIERVGPCRMEYGVPEFCSLAEAIVYQQLNGKAAVTIFNRFAALAGEPLTPEGKEKTDVHNPDASKHSRPIIGMVFMTGFTPAGSGKWENGTIYDPNNGNTYSCNMELEGTNTLKVRGYIGISLIGRTEIWKRAN